MSLNINLVSNTHYTVAEREKVFVSFSRQPETPALTSILRCKTAGVDKPCKVKNGIAYLHVIHTCLSLTNISLL